MEIKDILTVLLSSTLITAIITSLFAFFNNRKKDAVENITKERKTWRDELRKISYDISKSENCIDMQIAIDQLKVRINAYGIATNSVFADSHIWEQIHSFEQHETISSSDLMKIKRMFINQISCLLKYDWERSKEEVLGNSQARIVMLSWVVGFIFYSLRWLYYYNLGSGKIINFLSYCVVYYNRICNGDNIYG